MRKEAPFTSILVQFSLVNGFPVTGIIQGYLPIGLYVMTWDYLLATYTTLKQVAQDKFVCSS